MELVGRAEIIEDPDQLWALGVSVFERYYCAVFGRAQAFHRDHAAQAGRREMVVERTVSWDHRKLGLPPTRPAGT